MKKVLIAITIISIILIGSIFLISFASAVKCGSCSNDALCADKCVGLHSVCVGGSGWYCSDYQTCYCDKECGAECSGSETRTRSCGDVSGCTQTGTCDGERVCAEWSSGYPGPICLEWHEPTCKWSTWSECEHEEIIKCILVVSSVCGTDGNTYSNSCVAYANCVAVAHEGPCGCTDADNDGLCVCTGFPYTCDTYDNDPCSIDSINDNCGNTGCNTDSDGDGAYTDSTGTLGCDNFPNDPCSIIIEGDNCDSDGDGVINKDDSFPDDPCSIDAEEDNCGGTGCEIGSQAYNEGCDADDDGTPDSEDNFPNDPCSIIVEGDNCDSDGDTVVDSEDNFPNDSCSIDASQDNCGGTGCEVGSQPYIDSCISPECGVYIGECKGRLLCVKLNGNYGLVDSCEYDDDGRCCNIYGFSCINDDCDLTPSEEECNTRSQSNCDKDGCFWDYKNSTCSSCLNIYSCSDYNKCDGEMRCNDTCGVAWRSTQGCRTGFEMVEGNLYEIDTASCSCEWDTVEGCYLTYDRIGGPGGFTYPITCSDVIESECVGEVLSYTRTITPEGEEPTVITGTGLCGSAASPLPFFSLFNMMGVIVLIAIYYSLLKKRR